jgi:hypothetical protein
VEVEGVIAGFAGAAGVLAAAAGAVEHGAAQLGGDFAGGPPGVLTPMIMLVAVPAVVPVAGRGLSRGRVRRVRRGPGAVLSGGQLLEELEGGLGGRQSRCCINHAFDCSDGHRQPGPAPRAQLRPLFRGSPAAPRAAGGL